MSAADDLLRDDEADAFVAPNPVIAPEFQARDTALRFLRALERRHGRAEAVRALKAALAWKPLPRTKAQRLLRQSLHEVLKADPSIRNPTKRVEDMFADDGPLSDGQERASIRRSLRPSRRGKRTGG
jgi:hypothetical protein